MGVKFSLILATVDRTDEVERFLVALEAQTYRSFELIVVDQNQDSRLAPLFEPYIDSFPIRHLRAPDSKGASKARNVGLKYVHGTIVTCPDDDCWYPPQLLEQVACLFGGHPEIDGVSGRILSDPDLLTKSSSNTGNLGVLINSPLEALLVPGMVGLFLRSPVVDTVGAFDETLGPGAGTPWGSGEDTDYHLRILKAGFKLYSNRDVIVFHPEVQPYYSQALDLERTYRYGAGRGRVWKRHRLPLWYFAYEVGRSFGGIFLSLVQARFYKAYWHWGAFRGKLRGWFSR